MEKSISVNLPHHIKENLCTTRPAYRQGRKLTSVKVYTVNRESQHLLIYNVPAINLDSELRKLCERFGEVTGCEQIPCEDIEEFTSVYHARYSKVYQARLAKRKMDDMSFFGGILHVCYAPELETVQETKDKLSIRRKEVSFHLRKLEFPQTFRPAPRREKAKRKPQPSADDDIFLPTNYGINNFVHESQSEEPSCSGIVECQPKATPVVDVTPFKKLIPTKVSRIVFHKKTGSIT